jgi:RNA polymerase sigma-70 factor (ECF subfamily)
MLARAKSVASADDPIAKLISEGAHRQAVEQCVETYGAAIGRLCMAILGNQSDAEEVAQETLLAAHKAMSNYRGEGSVKAWLFGIARRQCARYLERNVGKHRHLRVVDEPATDGTPDGDLAKARRAGSVRAALALLKPSERETLILRYQADLSFREIADACGIEEAAARKRASRGLQHLRNTLTQEGVE